MTGPSRPRCPGCAAPNTAGQAFCGSCGLDLRTDWVQARPEPLAPAWVQPPPGYRPRSPIHGIMKALLVLWTIGYPIVSCSPLLAAGGSGTAGAAAGGLASVIAASVLFFPWIVGVLILGVLTLVTKP